MEDAVEENNLDIAALIGLKETWQAANVAASIGQALVATTLAAKNNAQDDYDEAVTDYAGFTPTEEEEEDGAEAVAGLLSVTEGLQGELDAAEATETGSAETAGSTENRDAAHIDYACKNCSASSDSGAAGGELVVQCGGTFQSNESTDYSSYSQSLASLEADVDDNLTTKNARSLTKAAKYLLKVEYNQIQKYLGYAVTNANLDQDVSNEALTSTDYSEYASEASEAVMTQAEIVTAMENGNSDLDESAHGVTGATASKAYTWINQLRLVYGRAAGNLAGDGDGTGDVDSFEYKAQQTGATGYADWVTDAGNMVAKLKLYLDTFNTLSGGTGVGEIGT